jgi:hypothetical protein
MENELYIEPCIEVPNELKKCRVWDEESKGFEYLSLSELEEKHMSRPIMYPITMRDDEGNSIFHGDMIKVTIETKHGLHNRIGIVRRQELYYGAVDYVDENMAITTDGDFIDEFYIIGKVVIGDIMRGVYKE